MGFSSDNPNTVGNMLQSYAANKSPLFGAGINSIAGDTKTPYGLNKDGTASAGAFHSQNQPQQPGIAGTLAQQVFGQSAAPQTTQTAPGYSQTISQNAQPTSSGLGSDIFKMFFA